MDDLAYGSIAVFCVDVPALLQCSDWRIACTGAVGSGPRVLCRRAADLLACQVSSDWSILQKAPH